MSDTAATPPTETETKKGKNAPPPPEPAAAAPPAAGTRESPRQKEWREHRAEMAQVVATLAAGDPSDPSSPMNRQGAAMMAAHLATEDKRAHKGLPRPEGPASKMTEKQILEYASIFRSRYPGAWGAANRCDTGNFMRFLIIAGLRGWPENEDTCELADISVEEMIVSYQSAMSQLA